MNSLAAKPAVKAASTGNAKKPLPASSKLSNNTRASTSSASSRSSTVSSHTSGTAGSTISKSLTRPTTSSTRKTVTKPASQAATNTTAEKQKANIEKHAKEIEELKAGYEIIISALKSAHTTEISELSSELEKQQLQSSKLESIETKIQDVEEALRQTKAHAVAKEAKLEEEITDIGGFYESKISKLEVDHATELGQLHAELEQQRRRSCSKLAGVESKIHTAEETLRQTKKRASQTEAELLHKNQKQDDLLSSVLNDLKVEIGQCQNKLIQEAAQQAEEKKAAMGELERAKSELEGEKRMRQEDAEAGERLAEAKSNEFEMEMNRMANLLADAERSELLAKSNIDGAAAEAERLSAALASAENRLEIERLDQRDLNADMQNEMVELQLNLHNKTEAMETFNAQTSTRSLSHIFVNHDETPLAYTSDEEPASPTPTGSRDGERAGVAAQPKTKEVMVLEYKNRRLTEKLQARDDEIHMLQEQCLSIQRSNEASRRYDELRAWGLEESVNTDSFTTMEAEEENPLIAPEPEPETQLISTRSRSNSKASATTSTSGANVNGEMGEKMTLEGTLESLRIQTEQLLEVQDDILAEHQRFSAKLNGITA